MSFEDKFAILILVYMVLAIAFIIYTPRGKG